MVDLKLTLSMLFLMLSCTLLGEVESDLKLEIISIETTMLGHVKIAKLRFTNTTNDIIFINECNNKIFKEATVNSIDSFEGIEIIISGLDTILRNFIMGGNVHGLDPYPDDTSHYAPFSVDDGTVGYVIKPHQSILIKFFFEPDETFVLVDPDKMGKQPFFLGLPIRYLKGGFGLQKLESIEVISEPCFKKENLFW